MPTDVVKKIGATSSPITMDYTILQAWEDASPANLVTADQRWIGECYDQGEFTGTTTLLTIGGTTVDATRYAILRCATGASFRDKAAVRTTPLYYDSTKGVAIRTTAGYGSGIAISCSQQYTQILDLQIKTAGNAAGAISLPAANVSISGSLLICTGTAPSNGILQAGSNANIDVINSILISTAGTAVVAVAAPGNNSRILGCTIVHTATVGGDAFRPVGYGTHPLVQNTCVFGYSNFKNANSLSPSCDYNASNLATVSGGAHDQASLTFSAQFTSSTNDFRAISSGSLDLNGTPDATNLSTDISRQTRDATTPTIGAWEVVSAGASYNLKPSTMLVA